MGEYSSPLYNENMPFVQHSLTPASGPSLAVLEALVAIGQEIHVVDMHSIPRGLWQSSPPHAFHQVDGCCDLLRHVSTIVVVIARPPCTSFL